jgi:hypothetical protein
MLMVLPGADLFEEASSETNRKGRPNHQSFETGPAMDCFAIVAPVFILGVVDLRYTRVSVAFDFRATAFAFRASTLALAWSSIA